jgi:hypothetical protein
MLVRTGMYHFEVSRTALYRVRHVLARTSTYHLVLPCTRCTGFQMWWSRKGCWFLAAPGYITGNADEHEKPVSDQAGNVGMWTTDREDITGRAAAGRAGPFYPEEQCSSLFRSYGPPLREERLRCFCRRPQKLHYCCAGVSMSSTANGF